MIFQIARCRKSEKLLGNSPMSRTEPLRTIKSPVAQLAGEFRGPRNRSVSSLLSGPSREITYRTSPPKAGKSPVFADLGALTRAIRQEEGPTTGISPVSALWRLFCKPGRLYGGEKPVTFRCFISGTGDFPMLSCAEPVILPR